jgi:hypothetical protein
VFIKLLPQLKMERKAKLRIGNPNKSDMLSDMTHVKTPDMILVEAKTQMGFRYAPISTEFCFSLQP